MAFLLTWEADVRAIVGEEALRRVAREVNAEQDALLRRDNNNRLPHGTAARIKVFTDNELTEKIDAFLENTREDACIEWELLAWDGQFYPEITIEKIGLEQ